MLRQTDTDRQTLYLMNLMNYKIYIIYESVVRLGLILMFHMMRYMQCWIYDVGLSRCSTWLVVTCSGQ